MAEVALADTGHQLRPPRLRLALLIVVGVAVVAAAALMVVRWTDRQIAPTAGARPPAESISALRQPQALADRLPTTFRHSVQLGSSRYLGTTPLGRHFVAVDLTGHMACFVTLGGSDTEGGQSTCTPSGDKQDPWLEVGSKPGDRVSLLPDGVEPSPGWTLISKNLAYSKG